MASLTGEFTNASFQIQGDPTWYPLAGLVNISTVSMAAATHAIEEETKTLKQAFYNLSLIVDSVNTDLFWSLIGMEVPRISAMHAEYRRKTRRRNRRR